MGNGSKKAHIDKNLINFFIILSKALKIIFNICSLGLRKVKIKSLEFGTIFFTLIFFSYYLSFNHRFLKNLNSINPSLFSLDLIDWLSSIQWQYYFLILFSSLNFLKLLFFGTKEYRERQKYQKAINRVSLKAGDGTEANLREVKKKDRFKTKLIIFSEGIGIDKFQAKKADLSSAFGQIIEKIKPGRNPKYTEIYLSKINIPTKSNFSELQKSLNGSYSFLIGESLSGTLIQNISTLPHLLIAGTTGGGKSVYFKQTLLGLLKTSPNLQMYLIDLKKGVEMKDFEELPNVKILKTELEAVKTLKMLKDEMDKRFDFLEREKLREINPKRDKLDKILIGIDEASVLYTKVKANTTKGNLIQEARELTDYLAKLGRAAGYHLILATQKVTKETIDTKVQENIGARMCFRMNTLLGSMTVLGNKKAYELPDIKGRGIWAHGNNFIEVQAPFISEEEIQLEVEAIIEEFNNKTRKNLGLLIEREEPLRPQKRNLPTQKEDES